jgi:hypothetical protein
MEAVFKAAVKNNTALEINSMPSRLDLKDTPYLRGTGKGSQAGYRYGRPQVEHLDYINLVSVLPAAAGAGLKIF